MQRQNNPFSDPNANTTDVTVRVVLVESKLYSYYCFHGKLGSFTRLESPKHLRRQKVLFGYVMLANTRFCETHNDYCSPESSLMTDNDRLFRVKTKDEKSIQRLRKDVRAHLWSWTVFVLVSK